MRGITLASEITFNVDHIVWIKKGEEQDYLVIMDITGTMTKIYFTTEDNRDEGFKLIKAVFYGRESSSERERFYKIICDTKRLVSDEELERMRRERLDREYGTNK